MNRPPKQTIIPWFFFIIPGALGFFVSIVWGFMLNVAIMYKSFGVLGIAAGILVPPLIFNVVPFYAYFKFQDSLPLLVSYGGVFSSTALIVFGIWLKNVLNNT